MESESLLKVTQSNAIKTNHIKSKIDKTLRNSRCRLCGVRNEMTNHMISKWSKTSFKRAKDYTQQGGQGDPQGIVQEV